MKTILKTLPLFLLLSTNAFAFGGKPLPQEKIDELVTTEVQCELVQSSLERDGWRQFSYSPAASFVVETKNVTEVWKQPTKCLSRIPTSEDPKSYLGYGCFPVTQKSVKSFNESRIWIYEDLGYGKQELDINLETGAGSFGFDVTYGWHATHDVGEALFRNCKIRK